MTIQILGADYTIEYRSYFEDPVFEREGVSGYCSNRQHHIVIGLIRTFPNFEEESCEVLMSVERETLRHEIIHAFLYESGLDDSANAINTSWAKNEEMIDWFALQGPKIFSVWSEIDIL